MKKIISSLLTAALFAAVVAAFVAVPQEANAQEPSVLNLDLPGGAANRVTFEYTNGVGRDAYSSLQIQHRVLNLDAAVTNTATYNLSRVHGVRTNVISSITVSSSGTSSVTAETNQLWIVRGDKLIASSIYTNAGDLDLIILER